MEKIKEIYAAFISKSVVVCVLLGVILAMSVVLFNLRGDVMILADAGQIELLMNMGYGLFACICILLVLIGWRFDHQPGRTIILGVSALMTGSFLNLFYDMAAGGGWLPIWNGLILGVMMIVGYIAWRIKARFALVALGLIIYTILVTTGVYVGLARALTTPVIIGIIAVGGYMYGLIFMLFDRIDASASEARREATANHITRGTPQALRSLLIWGAVPVLAGIPLMLIGEGAFRSLGVLLIVGGLVSLLAALACPAPLLLATRDLNLPAALDQGGQRRS